MDKEMQDRILYELIVTTIGTALFLLIWWVIEMPEWKRRALMEKIRPMAVAKDGLTALQRMEIRKFMQELSRWDHAS